MHKGRRPDCTTQNFFTMQDLCEDRNDIGGLGVRSKWNVRSCVRAGEAKLHGRGEI